MKQFSTVKRGYNPEEVENYVGKLEREIDDYREKDASISNAIKNAQIAADNIVRNANLGADEIKRSTIDHLDNIFQSIEKQKEIVKAFQEDYYELVSKYLKNTKTTDFLDIFASINELENYMNSLKKIEGMPAEAVPVPTSVAPPVAVPTTVAPKETESVASAFEELNKE